jgi:hypothetical protein
VDDAGQGLARLQTFQLFSSRDDRAWDVLEGGPYVHLDAVERAELDGARVHDLGPAPGHLGHLLEGDDGHAPGLGDDAGVGGKDARYVREDLAPVGPERRRQRHGRRVRAAAP